MITLMMRRGCPRVRWPSGTRGRGNSSHATTSTTSTTTASTSTSTSTRPAKDEGKWPLWIRAAGYAAAPVGVVGGLVALLRFQEESRLLAETHCPALVELVRTHFQVHGEDYERIAETQDLRAEQARAVDVEARLVDGSRVLLPGVAGDTTETELLAMIAAASSSAAEATAKDERGRDSGDELGVVALRAVASPSAEADEEAGGRRMDGSDGRDVGDGNAPLEQNAVHMHQRERVAQRAKEHAMWDLRFPVFGAVEHCNVFSNYDLPRLPRLDDVMAACPASPTSASDRGGASDSSSSNNNNDNSSNDGNKPAASLFGGLFGGDRAGSSTPPAAPSHNSSQPRNTASEAPSLTREQALEAIREMEAQIDAVEADKLTGVRTVDDADEEVAALRQKIKSHRQRHLKSWW